MLTILIIDDHPIMSAALADLVQQLAPKVTSIPAVNGSAAFQYIAAHDSDIDLIVLDLGLPDTDGFDLLGRLRDRSPSTPIVVVSASDDTQSVRRTVAAGALGFVAKSAPPATMLQALRQVLRGDHYFPGYQPAEVPVPHRSGGLPKVADTGSLSAREIDVLRLMCRGNSNKLIAHELNLAEKTVKGRITAIFKSLGVVNRTQAVLKAKENGLLSDC